MQQRGDFNTTSFWRWFECEAENVAAGVEGASSAECRLTELHRRISRYDPDLIADVRRLPDLTYEISINGTDRRSAMVLVLAAPRIAGWRISTLDDTPKPRRALKQAGREPSHAQSAIN